MLKSDCFRMQRQTVHRKKALFFSLLLITCLAPSAAIADMLVLVHGYMSGVGSWYESGVVGSLERAGWRNGGRYVATAQGVLFKAGKGQGARRYYTVDLPSEAPLRVQAKSLTAMLEKLRATHAEENLLLVGHSAGGVVARLAMVQTPTLKVNALITIASPHLGTDKAETALSVGSTPLAMLSPFVAKNTLNRSRALFVDLVREYPGSLLYWLNRQPHPKAHYISIVRKESLFSGDKVVPSWSQDMRRVSSLQGKAQSVFVSAGHALTRKDGVYLLRVMAEAALLQAKKKH